MFDEVFKELFEQISIVRNAIETLNSDPSEENADKLHEEIVELYETIHGNVDVSYAIEQEFRAFTIPALEVYEKLYKLPNGFSSEWHKKKCQTNVQYQKVEDEDLINMLPF